MSLLPASVPAIPEDRAGVVPARLARKIGPLFGVPWPDGPFGGRTWVSDFSRITLTEIARGAPQPTRAGGPAGPERGWEISDRVGLGSGLPNEIANATLNRFGPDTKAAVVLTGANVLLADLHTAVDDAADLLVDSHGDPLPLGTRLAGWASVVVEVFRSQPALLAAGIRARAIQRQLCTTWDLPRSPSGTAPITRCEISAPESGRQPSRPVELDLVDRGLRRLVARDPADTRGPVVRDETVDEAGDDPADDPVSDAADLLLARLLEVGTLRDSSHLWLGEREPGSLAVEALLLPTELVGRFVRRALRAWGREPGPAVLPAVPGPETFTALPTVSRRTVVVGLLAVLRQVQFDPVARERSRDGVLDRLERLAVLLDAGLPADDPVGAVTRCRIAVMRVQTLRHDSSFLLRDVVDDLLRSAENCAALAADGRLDRGAAAEILAAAHIEVNVVRWTNSATPGSGLPEPDILDRWLRRGWALVLEMLEVPDAVLAGTSDEVPGLLGFHLHNYTAFLASHTDRDEDLTAAVELFRTVVVPAREQFRARTGNGVPLRHSLQVGTRATTTLAARAADRGDTARHEQLAALGREWIHRALDDVGTAELLASAPTEIGCRFALHAVPALLTAFDAGVGTADDVRVAGDLVDLARRWEDTAHDTGTLHVRHAELAGLVRHHHEAARRVALNR